MRSQKHDIVTPSWAGAPDISQLMACVCAQHVLPQIMNCLEHLMQTDCMVLMSSLYLQQAALVMSNKSLHTVLHPMCQSE